MTVGHPTVLYHRQCDRRLRLNPLYHPPRGPVNASHLAGMTNARALPTCPGVSATNTANVILGLKDENEKNNDQNQNQ